MLRKRARSPSPELLPPYPKSIYYLLDQADDAANANQSEIEVAMLRQAIDELRKNIGEKQPTDEECMLFFRVYKRQIMKTSSYDCVFECVNYYDDYTPDQSFIAIINNMIDIYEKNPSSSDTDYQLTAAHAYLLAGFHGVAGKITNRIDIFNRYTGRGIAVLDTLFGERHKRASHMENTPDRFKDLTECYFLIGLVYSDLGDGQTSLTFMHRALDIWFSYCQQHVHYFAVLSAIYHSLKRLCHHGRIDPSYSDIFNVGYLLCSEDDDDFEFYQLGTLHQITMENFSGNSSAKLPFVLQIFAIISRSLEAGAFAKDEKNDWLAPFPRSTFAQHEMPLPYYQNQFHEMNHALRVHSNEFQRLANHPELIVSLLLETNKQREIIKALLAKVERLEKKAAQDVEIVVESPVKKAVWEVQTLFSGRQSASDGEQKLAEGTVPQHDRTP